jgi:biotin synthase
MPQKSSRTKEEIREIYNTPLLELVYRASTVHRAHHPANQVQVCSLVSIKTGGCTEDCKYCSQSARYRTGVDATPLMDKERVLAQAKQAIADGATRVCLGAAWRSLRDGPLFERILTIVREVADLGVEVCCTLGMLTESQAKRLKSAGLYAYNHNLDTSPEFYPSVITTRCYQDRLDTLEAVAKAKISICCGGIIGLGESQEDRISLIHILSTLDPSPDSIPINFLIPVPGTPFADNPPLSIWEILPMIATLRILLPQAMLRLSAGRLERSLEEQALCFLAGANSIFYGEKLLTCANPAVDTDREMFRLFGLTPLPSVAPKAEEGPTPQELSSKLVCIESEHREGARCG